MSRLPSQLTYNDLNGAEAVEILTDWFRQLLSTQPLLQKHLTLPMAKLTLNIAVQIDMYNGGTVPSAAPPETVIMSGEVGLTNDLSGGGTVGRLPASNASSAAGAGEIRCEHRETELSTVINTSPVAGGVPPDQVREQHDLHIPRPAYGPRDTGSHLFLADVEPPKKPAQSRSGIVADGYTFAPEVPAADVSSVSLSQTIPVDKGEIQIDLSGAGIRHESGITVKERDHRASVKEFGDERGGKYGSVNGVYDAGPAGLMGKVSRGGAGLGGDGRPRISFGNSGRG